MLVKVVLSYYMEGEHSQGANQSKGVWSGGEWGLLKGGGRGAAGHVLTCGRIAALGLFTGPGAQIPQDSGPACALLPLGRAPPP